MASTTTDRRFGVNVGQAIKVPCRVASTANLDLDGLDSVDGVTVSAEDRVLVRSQTTASENGIYLAQTGAWVRAPDLDGTYDAVGDGCIVAVAEGDTYANSVWYLADSYGPVVIGTDDSTWAILAWGWEALSLTNTRILKAGSNGQPADTLWTESTSGGTIAPVSTGQVIRDFAYQGYFETVQTVTSTTAGALSFALRDGNVIRHTLTQSCTVMIPTDFPTDPAKAVSWTLELTGTTNGYSVTWSTNSGATYDFGDGSTHAMSTGAEVDVLTFYGRGSTAGAPVIRSIVALTGGSTHIT